MAGAPRRSGGPPMTRDFYDGLAPHYHLIFGDWEASIGRQGKQLDSVIRTEWPGTRAVLDAAAGVGTQALALAGLGYEVTASDISTGAVRRCRREAAARGLPLRVLAADLRDLAAPDGRFDLVVACDNALPHLLSDEELGRALRECLRCVRPGGGCLVSVRDYPEPPRTGVEMHPYGVKEANGARLVLWQVWTWDGPCYDLAFYVAEDRGGAECVARVFRTRYYAVPVSRLLALMREAGFERVRRLDGAFFQPVLVGTRPRTGGPVPGR